MAVSSSLYVQTPLGTRLPVHPSRLEVATSVNQDENPLISDQEIKAYLAELGEFEAGHKVDETRLLNEFRAHLARVDVQKLHDEGLSLDEVSSGARYSTYEEVGEKLGALATQYPELCERVSLGKSAEGREIWALRIGNSQQPGVVITGCHHAREWMTVEIPLNLAEQLLTGYDKDPAMKARVDQGEIWIVPLVNPDGYEYSRTRDNWWRKNRRVVDNHTCPNAKPSVGVDPNRNYDDGKPEHFAMYRPEWDKPCRTLDDSRATSDHPAKETYRGPFGASEPEVQAMLNLQLGRGNIKGVLDFHSYGEMILYPYGSSHEPPENVAVYKEIGTKMNAALGNSYDLMQADELYQCFGTSNDIQHANGILGMTMEVGRSFQPPPREIPATCAKVNQASLVFIDEVLARSSGEPA